MTRTRSPVLLLLVLGVAAVGTGCVAVRIRSTVAFDESQAVHGTFASADAAALFYASLNKNTIASDDPAYTSSGVCLPVLVLVHREAIRGTAYYNAQIRKADANMDGTISEIEAFRYAALNRKTKR